MPSARLKAKPKLAVPGSTTTETGNVFVPRTPESYWYHLDGNLLGDGRWTYTWDGENRLISMESLASAPAGSKLKLEFEYDYMGRRIRKKSYTWNGSAYVLSTDRKFLYDAWNLLAELNASNNGLFRAYMLGLDLSGSLQGAGGVGGLLKVTHASGTHSHHFVAHDGNGNVRGLVDRSNGTITHIIKLYHLHETSFNVFIANGIVSAYSSHQCVR